ncbi:hypothetical protein Gotri_019101 [Gossypium trilobum]|uniref:RNase H type-1 domain-containing protein n=1 Tax=Gossypium trilobum TaxID=34281 RepID=A0A7J9EBR5_9ROSI|nr:hypothetical protein [Gossypium trilobum]
MILPTNAKVATIQQNVDRGYPRCGAEVEIVIHAFMDVPNPMPISLEVCSATGSSMVIVLVLLTSSKMQYGYSTKKDFLTTLWNGWNSQNNFIFYGKDEEKWEKPPNDFVKVKVDAACRNNTMSYGIIIRDCDGLIIVGQAGVKDVQMKLEWAELYALSEGVLIARDLNLGHVIFETDCANMVNHLRKCQDDIIILGFHAKEIDGLIKQILKARVQLINRSCNKVVDALCNFSLLYSYFLRFGMNYLSCIHNLVILDSS